MTEKELRQSYVNAAVSYLGCKESNGSHKKIIDLYNSHKPLARNYAVKYTDSWCATFVSAMAIKTGLTDIIPTECGCGQMIQLFQKAAFDFLFQLIHLLPLFPSASVHNQPVPYEYKVPPDRKIP